MKMFIENASSTLWFSLNVLRWVGFLVPEKNIGLRKSLMNLYALLWFIIIDGVFIAMQVGELIQVWGVLSLMTETSFLMLTNISFAIKIINLMIWREAVLKIIEEGDHTLRTESRLDGKAIIERSNRDTKRLVCIYILFAPVTVIAWSLSAEKGKLPLRAWFPYDATKSPAYELTFTYQAGAGILSALVDVILDALVASLMAVCRCRLKLLALSLRTLCHDIEVTNELMTPQQDEKVSSRLRRCVIEHQAILDSAAKIQAYFNKPILVQFNLSTVIICVTAYELAIATDKNIIRFLSMIFYLAGLLTQVFLYCYEGHCLAEESLEITDAAYESSWYVCSNPIRRSLLLLMTRANRVAQMKAGGITILSLSSFVSIVKLSYSFFTVLQTME